MSTDFSVANHTRKTWWHLGQRMATFFSFGYGSSDREGRECAAELIADHVGDRMEIVDTDYIPDDYEEIVYADTHRPLDEDEISFEDWRNRERGWDIRENPDPLPEVEEDEL